MKENQEDRNKVNNEEYIEDTDIYIDEKTEEIINTKEFKEAKKKDNSNEDSNIVVKKTSGIKKVTKKKKKLLIIMACVIVAFVISFAAIGIINKMNTSVYKNVYLNGKSVTGMTIESLKEHLKKAQEEISKAELSVFQEKEEIIKILPEDIELEIDIVETEKKVFGFGRDSNILINNIEIISALLKKKEYSYTYKYNVNKLSEVTKEVKESLDNKAIKDNYILDEKEYKLIITKGKSGKSIEEEVFKKDIIDALTTKKNKYKVNTVIVEPEVLDVDVVYSEVSKEPKDAYIDKTSTVIKLVPHQVGLDFNKDALRELLKKPENNVEEKVIEYKLEVKEPSIKTTDLKWDAYDYKITSYTTYFSTADKNRVNNLKISLELLNGKVLMPEETFSYGAIIGGATAAQGFLPAATFVGGRVTREVGGGVCQTVSTLYNVALLSNLEIVQRRAHSLPVGYVPGSRDATIYHPSIDFKFKNTRKYPVKIVTSINLGGNLTISLYGTKEENEYQVSISSRTLSTIPYKTEYVNDATLAEGKQVVTQNGSNGYVSEAYITKKLNGKVVSTTFLSKDTYKSVSKIVKVGTKKEQKTVIPVEPPVPEKPAEPVEPAEPPVVDPIDEGTGNVQED
ncbi:MAG: VanW family protein [Clostridia bacterium]|nr:VanW family protein [Clostridia bacterium]